MQTCCSSVHTKNATLGASRTVAKTASCKTIRGRDPVDGIGSIPRSMISTKGLELTNFINPDLTWKTVSKGYRSATRRSRKQLDRSPKSDADLPDKGTESPSEITVSESEKVDIFLHILFETKCTVLCLSCCFFFLLMICISFVAWSSSPWTAIQ